MAAPRPQAVGADRLLSLMQLATRWGWSRDRLYSLVKKRGIPFIRIGHGYFFREADVDRWLEEQTVQPKAAAVPAPPVPHRKTDKDWAQVFDLDEDELLH